MSEMFANCSALKELDLSSFNTSNVEDVRKIFYGCTNLKTTYAQDQMVKADDDYKDAQVTGISAVAKTDFTKGIPIMLMISRFPVITTMMDNRSLLM